MLNKFCKKPLWECNEDLVRVARGDEFADLVIRHADVVSVATQEILPDSDIAIKDGRIAYLGMDSHTAEHCVGPDTQVIDATGLVATPGLMDSHIHVESSMTSVSEYARAVVPHGTTAILTDPHEVGNVRGLEGVKSMFEDAKNAPLKSMMTPPSCVPAVLGVEDTGASITDKDIAETMTWDNVVALGEMMNFPGILSGEKNALGEVRATLRADRVVTGHFPSPDVDRDLNAYIASGVSSDHECGSWESVLAKLRLGQYVQLRYGSAWLNLPGYLPQLIESGVCTAHCLLCTDDCHPNTLVSDGHMDRVLREAVRLGLDPIVGIQMCTVNAAHYLGLTDMGVIAPGKCADIVLFKDLSDFDAKMVFIDGELVAQDGVAKFPRADHQWPDWMTHTMSLGFEVTPQTFEIPALRTSKLGVAVPNGATVAEALGDDACAPVPDGTVTVRAIGITPGDTITRDEFVEVPVKNGLLVADHDHDVLKACVFDRHHGADGVHSFGFVTGFGIHGALAQTVSHDAHNLLVMGDNDEDMALAAQTLVECGGGETAVVDGKILALVELPVCGLMSAGSIDDVAAQVAKAEEAWKQMGCTMPSPFMTMGVMSLACVPVLRLTNRGYVNCVTFQMEPLMEEK